LAAARLISIALASLALLAGLIAAWYWYRSSQVDIDPGWYPANPTGPSEPVDPEQRQMDWTAAKLKAFKEVAAWNKKAALWTAGSVGLSAASAIVGAFASN
jgi:hypothetical protein